MSENSGEVNFRESSMSCLVQRSQTQRLSVYSEQKWNRKSVASKVCLHGISLFIVTLLFRGVGVMRLPPVRPLVLVFGRGGGAVETAAGVFPPRLLPLGRFTLLVVTGPSLRVALHVGVGHQVDVAVRVAFETNQHHACQDGEKYRQRITDNMFI